MSSSIKSTKIINPAYIFGHQRQNVNSLTSTVSVKELCLKNKDTFASGLISNSICVAFFDNKYPEDFYIRKAAIRLAVLDDVENNVDKHCGNCTKVASTCLVCLSETIYTDGLENLSYFDSLLQKQNKESKNILSRFTDTCILFMTICQLQETYWNEYAEFCKKNFAIGCFDCYDKDCPEYDESLKDFLAMSRETQDEKYERMKKVREYIENPTPIEGIPWW